MQLQSFEQPSSRRSSGQKRKSEQRRIPPMEPAAQEQPIPLTTERAQLIELVRRKKHEPFELTRRKAKQADEIRVLALDTGLAKEQLRSVEREEPVLKRAIAKLDGSIQDLSLAVEGQERNSKNLWSRLKGIFSSADRDALERQHKKLASLEGKRDRIQEELDSLRKKRQLIKRQIEKNQTQTKRLEQEVIKLKESDILDIDEEELGERDIIDVEEKLDKAA